MIKISGIAVESHGSLQRTSQSPFLLQNEFRQFPCCYAEFIEKGISFVWIGCDVKGSACRLDAGHKYRVPVIDQRCHSSLLSTPANDMADVNPISLMRGFSLPLVIESLLCLMPICLW